jgi:hypothetical protein
MEFLIFILIAMMLDGSRSRRSRGGGTAQSERKARTAWAINPRTGECCGCKKVGCDGRCG